MKKFAVIVAGGSGKRMGNAVPKQFLLLKNKPLLWYTLDSFLRAYADLQIILVLPKEHESKGRQIIALTHQPERISIVAGGDTRFHSVKAGLQTIHDKSVIFVHDGVRCLVSVPLIHSCYKQALELGSAIPSIMATDSIRIAANGNYVVADRRQIRIVQTPQTFLSEIILPAFEQEYSDSFTDEATVVEAYGKKVFLTEGEYDNIKITRPIDLTIAEKIIEERFFLQG